MSGKRIYELTEKSNLENDYFMALDKSGTANAQKVNVSKILNPINNISGSSDEYSASKAYTNGELVIHDNKLYVCNTSCSAAAWSTNQGYFTQSTLATEVTNVKSSLAQNTAGRFVLPNGLKICWGLSNVTDAYYKRDISFPVSFGSAPIIICQIMNSSNDYAYTTHILTRSTTGFSWRANWINMSSGDRGGSQDDGMYVAIGY